MDTQRPVCAQEAMKLLNCVAGPEFDQEKCLGLLHSLRERVLNKAEKRDAVGMQEKALNFEVSQVQSFWPHFEVPKFTQDLCTLEVPPMDSQTPTEALHADGINIRYIGKGLLRETEGLLKETEDHYIGPAIAHFLNCFFGNCQATATKIGNGKSSRGKGRLRNGISTQKTPAS